MWQELNSLGESSEVTEVLKTLKSLAEAENPSASIDHLVSTPFEKLTETLILIQSLYPQLR